jgi:hypothetical protein
MILLGWDTISQKMTMQPILTISGPFRESEDGLLFRKATAVIVAAKPPGKQPRSAPLHPLRPEALTPDAKQGRPDSTNRKSAGAIPNSA